MNLYKVTGGEDFFTCTFIIVSVNEAIAILKYLQVSDKIYHSNVQCEFLCRRDDIITTIDPKIEFKDL